VPCVAFDVDNADDATALAAAGADFIAMRLGVDLATDDYAKLASVVAEAASRREAIA
jgi:hypothetical protein